MRHSNWLNATMWIFFGLQKSVPIDVPYYEAESTLRARHKHRTRNTEHRISNGLSDHHSSFLDRIFNVHLDPEMEIAGRDRLLIQKELGLEKFPPGRCKEYQTRNTTPAEPSGSKFRSDSPIIIHYSLFDIQCSSSRHEKWLSRNLSMHHLPVLERGLTIGVFEYPDKVRRIFKSCFRGNFSHRSVGGFNQ
jgi:hypothetical protein